MSILIKNKVIYIKDNDLSLKDLKKMASFQGEKVALSWKPLIKKVKKENLIINSKEIFDINIANWLLNPDENKEMWSADLNNLPNIHKNLKSKLKKESLDNIFYELELPLIEILADMEEKGIKIDTTKLPAMKKSLEKEIENIKKRIFKKAGEEFNINSSQQLSKILFEKLDIETKKRTPTGKLSTSEEALKDIKTNNDIIKDILSYRSLFKKISGFIEPLIKHANNSDRIHTTFLQSSTATGRLSSESPNLQNIPGDIRQVFISDKNKMLVSFDYSQLELRLLAHETQDETLLKAVKEGQDLHVLTASKIFNKNIGDVNKKQRSLAKTLNFGIIYGMGKRSFSKQSGLSLKESEKMIDKYFSDFPKIKKWQKTTIEEAIKNGYVINSNGRIRRINNKFMERAIINMPIQSFGADIIKKGMIDTNRIIEEKGWSKKCDILLSIHDELLIEIEENMLELITDEIKTALEKVYKISVPLLVNVKKGYNWLDLK